MQLEIHHTDIVIIGAGAAGLFSAAMAARRGRSVILLDHADRPGKKILISGGGRCNFTNIHTTYQNFISENPDFCRSALQRFKPQDFIALVEKHGISYHEKTLGQLFCDNSSRQIVDMLIDECRAGGVQLQLDIKVKDISKATDGYTVHCDTQLYHCSSLILATGGMSIPKMGATDFTLRWAKKFGHTIISPRPALVPLLIPEHIFPCSQLAGLSLNCITKTEKTKFPEALLFTHKGLSGPAILQISSYLQKDTMFSVDLLPVYSIPEIISQHSFTRMEWKNVLAHFVPKRLADQWCSFFNLNNNFAHYSMQTKQKMIEQMKNWQLPYQGDEGYAKAEVMAGGINTKELSSKTMMSAKSPNLFFIGEAVDITGHLGGFNFQWAWASAYAAAQFA